MPPDPLAELTRLQEQDERAVEGMEEHRRQLATLQAHLEDAKRRGEAPGAVEAWIEAAEASCQAANPRRQRTAAEKACRRLTRAPSPPCARPPRKRGSCRAA